MLQHAALCQPGARWPLGGSQSNGDGIHSDAVLSYLASQCAGKSDHTHFARHVMNQIRSPEPDGIARKIDNTSPALLLHRRKHSLGCKEETSQINIQHPLPRIQRQQLEWLFIIYSGIINEDINAPKPLLDLGGHRAGRGFTGHVHIDDERLFCSCNPPEMFDGLEGLDNIAKHDLRARAREFCGKGAAIANRRPGNNNDSPFVKLCIHSKWFSCTGNGFIVNLSPSFRTSSTMQSPIMEAAISTTALVKTFGTGSKSVHALQSVSLAVGRGEIFGLLGPNGAGKTTLIKCALGIVFPTKGSGTIMGYPFGSVAAKEHIGYLPENHRYPPHLTGGQVLRYFGKLSGIREPLLSERITETLKITGMSDWRDTKVRKYSKGMMQRLGLAQALINDPDLIMLDEPTDGVDPVGRKEIREVLMRLKGEGKTVFLNSHLLSEVERISDRVAILDHGKVIREGRVEDLTRAGETYELKLDRLDDAVLAQLHARVTNTDEHAIEIDCATGDGLNRAMDTLRAAGINIASMAPKRSSLEDIFVDLIQSSDVTHQ